MVNNTFYFATMNIDLKIKEGIAETITETLRLRGLIPVITL